MRDKIAEAVEEAKKNSKPRKFKQTIELAVNLKDIDMKKPENRINEEVLLPHGKGKPVKIAVFATGELAMQAKKLADLVITKEGLEELAKNKRKAKKIAKEYDFFIAQADLMPLIGRYLGPILGPRGKMPKPVPPNANLEPIINRLRKTVRIRTKDNPVFHVPVGTEDMPTDQVVDNIETIFKFLENKLEKGLGNVKSAYVKTTMGKAVRVI